MASGAHNQVYPNEPQDQQPHWHKRLFEGEDDVVLDEHILDSHSLDMAAVDHNQRRESFASNPSLVSPTQQTWPEFAYNNEPTSNYPLNHQPAFFPDHGGNQYSQPEAPQYANYGNPVAHWQPQGTQGPGATNPPFQTFPSEIETIKPEAPYNNEVPPSQPPNIYGGLPVQMDSEYPPYPVPVASPQWSTSSSDNNVEKIPRSGHFQSPMYNLSQPQLRRDGVRKKNARFDIPEGHNLQTIDNLINSTNPNDEDTIKTLKQQKRLLRNRQAALDSRCRKKHHTEKLEEEKKQYLAIIDRLEDDVASLKMNEQRWMQERQQWHQYTDDLVRQKEELVRQHTLETADLRRKNTFLTEEAQRLESVSMSTQPSSAGVSAGFPEFEHLTMDSSPFDDFSFIDNPIMGPEAKQETSLMVQPKRESPTPTNSDDKTTAPGLLLMLLLCGAWVASKSTGSTPAAIPRMSDDVRVASSAILENIYKDAGVQPHNLQQVNTKKTSVAQAGSRQPPTTNSFSSSSLGSLHNDLTKPSEQQQREQLFSLSVDQYNHITCDDHFGEQQDAKPTQRRNLGEALAAMRAEKKGPAAEVYTRSLMMNEVPADVVRDFARMMADANAARHGGEPLS